MKTFTQAEVNIAAPVAEANRIKTIDMLRGVALLGILLMNIPGFSMPNYFSEAWNNDPGNLNFWVNAVITVFFEGKMRALFGMLFGAGVLLFVMKKEQAGHSVHGLFYRRMFWLVLFGLFHAHIILWVGDILYVYGICGMLVYLFRNVKPKYLVLGVPLVAVLGFVAGTLFYQDIRAKRIAYVDAVKAQSQNQTLTGAQTNALTTWREIETSLIPNREDAKKNTEKMRSDYRTVASYLRPLALKMETQFMPMELPDSVALMLLGLALLKWGFFTGQWSRQDYRKVAMIGYGVGLPLVSYSVYYNFLHYSTLEANLARMEQVPINWTELIYPFQRIFLVMAHTAALILLYQSGVLQGLFRRLAAVGQMAFTNYIMHSVICTLFFFGYGLNYFGRLEFYQIYYVVLAIWVLQLLLSPVWLRSYLFGPLEWLWRSLTYWRLQPMRRG
ncbi:MAG: DUF418 domain-containing protein [Blastocatellia bacterium]